MKQNTDDSVNCSVFESDPKIRIIKKSTELSKPIENECEVWLDLEKTQVTSVPNGERKNHQKHE
jgi:hypothetical protein